MAQRWIADVGWRTALAAAVFALATGAAQGGPAHARAKGGHAAASTRGAHAGHIVPSGVAAQLADWVAATHDAGDRPFVIIDKLGAEIFVFDQDGRLKGGAPALVGLAPGDDSAAGIGERKLSAITPDERTTPAGRFVASFGPAVGHKKVLWVDYADAISLHPVITTNPKEHRLRRIKSAAPEDHRISYGCINVPASFYEKVVLSAFKEGSAVVYILPDTRPLDEVFPAFAATLEAGGVDASVRSLAPQP